MNRRNEGPITRKRAKKIKLDEDERLTRQNAVENCEKDQRITPSTSARSNDSMPFPLLEQDESSLVKVATVNREIDALDCDGADGNYDTNSGHQNTNDASNDIILSSNMESVNAALVDGTRNKCAIILKQEARIRQLEDTNQENEMLIVNLRKRNTLLKEIMARKLLVHDGTKVLLDQPQPNFPHPVQMIIINRNFLEVADNLVCMDHLLSFLGVNDLLRLRRVSKQFKAHADDFIRRKKVATEQEINIDFSVEANPSETIQSKCLNLPIRTRAEFWDIPQALDESLQTWLETWATNITHFNWSSNEYTSDAYVKFFTFLPNLLHLKIWDQGGNFETIVPAEDIRFPAHVANLKTLIIEQCTSAALPYIDKLVDTCILNLERISLPLYHLFEEGARAKNKSVRLVCKCLFNAPKLKLEQVFGGAIEELLRVDNRTGPMKTLDIMKEFINAKVISIQNPRKMSFELELPNLEEIDFGGTVLPEPGSFERSEWPKLKTIKVNLYDGDIRALGQMWGFLFVGIMRQSVLELDIKYCDEYDKYNHETFFSVMDIPKSCPNLKTLHMRGSFPILLNPSVFWGAFPFLEKLHIEYGDLRDSGFIGSDPQIPAFWNLKNLKVLKLWMKRTDFLTNKLFSQVLCHMPLKELYLSSSADIHSITLDGIRSLLNGQFANTVEKLSISSLRLAGVTQEDKAKVESLFRSSQMI